MSEYKHLQDTATSSVVPLAEPVGLEVGPVGGAGVVPPLSTSPTPIPGNHNTEVNSQRKKRGLQAARHVEYVQHLDRLLRSRVTKMQLAMLRAPEVAANGPPPDMTATELRIARDAMMGEREAPAYLRMSGRILESYKRAEVMSERDPAPRLNVETIQVAITSNNYSYEVIEAPETQR